MSAPVDVLAVIADAATYVGPDSVELRKAHAAVDELIEAISAFKGKRGAFMALGAQDRRTLRLWAALARVGGAA